MMFLVLVQFGVSEVLFFCMVDGVWEYFVEEVYEYGFGFYGVVFDYCCVEGVDEIVDGFLVDGVVCMLVELVDLWFEMFDDDGVCVVVFDVGEVGGDVLQCDVEFGDVVCFG